MDQQNHPKSRRNRLIVLYAVSFIVPAALSFSILSVTQDADVASLQEKSVDVESVDGVENSGVAVGSISESTSSTDSSTTKGWKSVGSVDMGISVVTGDEVLVPIVVNLYMCKVKASSTASKVKVKASIKSSGFTNGTIYAAVIKGESVLKESSSISSTTGLSVTSGESSVVANTESIQGAVFVIPSGGLATIGYTIPLKVSDLYDCS